MPHSVSPPSPAASSASDVSSNSVSTGPPQTPVLAGLPLETPLPSTKAGDPPSSPSTNPSAGGVKRTGKASRRANTAERRATHNAVERQRRETLNGRFLDLAALLPNLSQIRRPSKSAIVNSSIAHINASRRHRLLAARELRLLKNESDALRHEVNEWRVRAGVPAAEEPRRADSFGVVLSGELEIDAYDLMEGSEDADEDEYGGGAQYGFAEEPEEYILQQQQQQQQQAELIAQQQQQPFISPTIVPRQSPPHYGSPMIASPTAAAFDPAALAYDQHAHARQLHQHQQLLLAQQQENEKWAYHQQQQQMRGAPQPAW